MARVGLIKSSTGKVLCCAQLFVILLIENRTKLVLNDLTISPVHDRLSFFQGQCTFPPPPPKPIPSESTFNSITFLVRKIHNPCVTGFRLKYWKYGRRDSTKEKAFSFQDGEEVEEQNVMPGVMPTPAGQGGVIFLFFRLHVYFIGIYELSHYNAASSF